MIDAPANITADAIAIQSRTAAADDGWLYFCSGTHQRPDTAVGTLALVAVRDDGLRLAHVRRGYRRGAFNLCDSVGNVKQSAELAWASPVLWIRCSTG